MPDLTQRITICAATSQRQQEAEKLSGEADVMVVVGGKNSSNTQKLLETCRLRCKRSILVETPEDVPQNLAKADDRVALTAGASTPQWLLEQVRARIEENAKEDTQKNKSVFPGGPRRRDSIKYVSSPGMPPGRDT